ncbi:MAG: RnfABCDGE type electron transport complex subunit D [Gammaproteobacteria bacterium]|nr:RnfABCDGE type electron transport complex subunit D [Gammaproteobacteria bacterium]
MATLRKTLEIDTSPHISSGAAVDSIMRNVVFALLPVCIYAVYVFGLTALVTLVVATLTCLVSEQLLGRRRGAPSTLGDWSVAVTGVLYGLILPPGLPLWMVVTGGVAGVGVGKVLFGGLGYNAFNPALVGRAFLAAAFPVAMTTWYPALGAQRFAELPSSLLALPFATPVYDSISGATPLAAMKFDGEVAATADLVMGLTSGSMGETSGLLILLGGAYLVVRRMMNWRIPIAIFAAVYALSGAMHLVDPGVYPSPMFMLFAGGLMLGAVFMATDMVASPMTSLGCVLYGVLIGVLVVVIRLWGGMPEGVMYAILLANAVSPHIDNLIRPRVYGTTERGAS